VGNSPCHTAGCYTVRDSWQKGPGRLPIRTSRPEPPTLVGPSSSSPFRKVFLHLLPPCLPAPPHIHAFPPSRGPAVGTLFYLDSLVPPHFCRPELSHQVLLARRPLLRGCCSLGAPSASLPTPSHPRPLWALASGQPMTLCPVLSPPQAGRL
jgi:hypothetical protein